MKEINEFYTKRQNIINKYSQVDAAGQVYVAVEDNEDLKQELVTLEQEYKDVFSDFSDKGFMINQLGMLVAEQQKEKPETIVYNEEKIKEEHQKIFDGVYRIEVEVLDGGTLPCKAHKTDAGFDLFATEDVEISFGQGIKHPLNIKMKLPEGSYAQIETKSGLGSKGMLVYAGVIDEAYRGIPHVVAAHIRSDLPPIKIKKGQKIAQMTMRPHSNNFYIAEVDEVSEDTERGDGGFGSTGV